MRERFSSISVAVSIRSKPNSRFQTLCFSCINKLRICPRRCVAASFATRTVSRRRQIVVPRSSDILAKSRSSVVIFKKSDKNAVVCVHLIPWSRRTISSKSPGSLGFPGCALLALLRQVPPTLALSLQRSRSIPRPCVLYVQSCTPLVLFRAGDVAALGRCGHRQISTVTQFQAHPFGFLHWARGPCSRAAGGSLLTGAILKARSADGVSGSFGRSVVKPKLLAGLLPFVPSLALLHNISSDS